MAIYLRVSSKSQDTASQEAELKRWAATQDEPVKWYHDTFTGKSMDRPDFNRLERDIAAGNVSTLVVWWLDRLGRTAKGLTALFEDLTQRKVNLFSLRDSLDLSAGGPPDGQRLGQCRSLRNRGEVRAANGRHRRG